MPPFLSTRDESKGSSSGICVRYALSAFEDLNSAIKNLRRCFGFPYQEYIGYLNTLSRTHRARREHEALVDRLRKWAIFGNVDAVVWIDYAKANQPPGSFKMGPRDSRPFSQAHMELCLDLDVYDDNAGGDSEAAWSDEDDEVGERAAPRDRERETLHHPQQQADASQCQATRKPSLVLQRNGGGSVPLKRLVRADELCDQGEHLAWTTRDPKSRSGSAKRDHSLDFQSQGARLKQENALLRTMIQEEVIPGHGSIYTRSIAPGPGYYGSPGCTTFEDGGGEFGTKPKSRMDIITEAAKDLPGPGDYTPRVQQLDDPQQLGKIGKGPRLVLATQIHRKLPFISAQASESEGRGLYTVNVLHSLLPTEPCFTKPPKYSFGKMKRPF